MQDALVPALTADEAIAHNAAVARLWEDYGRCANERVPITLASDEALWLNLTGHSFREFYTDAEVQLHAQLAGQAWMCQALVHDQRFGVPEEAWTVTPRFWMDEPEVFGCQVVIQEDTFAWSQPLALSKRDLLGHLADLDMEAAVRRSRLWQLYCRLRDLAAGMTWCGLPVRVAMPGGGTHGIFTTACHVRGAEQLCLDLVEDPDFVRQFLDLMVDQTVARIRAWHRLAETGTELPLPAWGMADDSLQFISAATYRQCVLPCHQRLYATMTNGCRSIHLCGHASQHYGILYDELGIRLLDGPGPFVDLGELLAAFPELTVNAHVDHTVLLLGPEEAIERMIHQMLTPAAKQPGRLQVMGFLVPDTPLRNVRCLYEAGRAFGRLE